MPLFTHTPGCSKAFYLISTCNDVLRANRVCVWMYLECNNYLHVSLEDGNVFRFLFSLISIAFLYSAEVLLKFLYFACGKHSWGLSGGCETLFYVKAGFMHSSSLRNGSRFRSKALALPFPVCFNNREIRNVNVVALWCALQSNWMSKQEIYWSRAFVEFIWISHRKTNDGTGKILLVFV